MQCSSKTKTFTHHKKHSKCQATHSFSDIWLIRPFQHNSTDSTCLLQHSPTQTYPFNHSLKHSIQYTFTSTHSAVHSNVQIYNTTQQTDTLAHSIAPLMRTRAYGMPMVYKSGSGALEHHSVHDSSRVNISWDSSRPSKANYTELHYMRLTQSIRTQHTTTITTVVRISWVTGTPRQFISIS